MNIVKLLIISLVMSSSIMPSYDFAWSNKLEQKIRTMTEKTFDSEDFQFDSYVLGTDIDEQVKSVFSDHLFRISSQENNLGYLYVNKAPSLKNEYDYAIILSNDLKIINTKVLIYREQHGRQIGAKRWLKQFFGMTSSDRPVLGQDIDGISGATISATSMTKAIHTFLENIDYLINHGTLNAE